MIWIKKNFCKVHSQKTCALNLCAFSSLNSFYSHTGDFCFYEVQLTNIWPYFLIKGSPIQGLLSHTSILRGTVYVFF